jgi:hypothetical protein
MLVIAPLFLIGKSTGRDYRVPEVIDRHSFKMHPNSVAGSPGSQLQHDVL